MNMYLGDSEEQPSPSVVSEWFSTATDFKRKYAQYRDNVAALQNSTVDAAKYPDIAKARSDLLQRASDIDSKTKAIIDGIESTYDAAKNFLISAGKTVSTLYAPVAKVAESAGKELYNVVDWFKTSTGLNGLGFLPLLIPVAIIAASLATIGYWINDAYKLNKRVALIKDAEAKGMTPAQATALANNQMGPINAGGILDFLSNIKGIAMYAGLGVALFFGYKLYKDFKGK